MSSYQNNLKLSFIDEDKESLSLSKANSASKISLDRTQADHTSVSKSKWYQPVVNEAEQVEVPTDAD